MELPKTNQALRVATLSLTQRNQALLEFFFANAGHSRFVMTDENQADAAIFDFDNMASRLHWERFHEERQKPGIALSVTAQEVPMTCWVQKPVTPVAMMEAANRLRNGDWYRPAVSKEVLLDAITTDPIVASADEEGVSTPAATNQSVVLEAVPQTVATTDAPPVISVPEIKVELTPPAPVVAPVTPSAPPSATVAKAPAPASVTASVATPSSPNSGQAKKGGGFLSRLWGKLTGADTEVKPAVIATPSSISATTPPAPEKVSAPTPHVAQTSMLLNAGVPAVVETPVVTPSTSSNSGSVESKPSPSNSKVEKPNVVPPQSPSAPVAKANIKPVATAAPAPRSISTTPAATTAKTARKDHKDKNKENKTEAKAKPTAKPTAATVSTSEKLKPEASERELAEAPMYCGEHADVPVGQIAQTAGLFYNYNDYLIAALRETHLVGARWRSPTRLDLDFGTVIYVPLENCMYLDFPEERLYTELSVCHPGRYKVRMVAVQEFADMQNDLPHYHRLPRFDAMLWKLALQTSLGRLPQGTDLKQELFLKAWPNMTRFQPTPHAMRIAALWANHGATLLETVQKLDIPQRYVFAFYNAAFSSDLLTTDGSRIKQAKRRSHKSQGTWSRLFSWLRRA